MKTKQLYIITYENAHWCGGELHCLVQAHDEDDAIDLADTHMDECQRELFCDYFDEDEEGLDEEMSYTVNSVELLEDSDLKRFVALEDQASFYPYVNSND
ncbi:MAG: hypothetical protein QX189_04670 [Methylococcales bacterium]